MPPNQSSERLVAINFFWVMSELGADLDGVSSLSRFSKSRCSSAAFLSTVTA